MKGCNMPVSTTTTKKPMKKPVDEKLKSKPVTSTTIKAADGLVRIKRHG